MSGDDKPTVFISYSHKDEDEAWKDRLVDQLKVSQKQQLLHVWEDKLIGGGEDWERKINDAMNAASVAVLLVSANSLASDFIQDKEVKRLLERQREGGLNIFPIIVTPCDWEAVAWLRGMNLRPRDAKPLSTKKDSEIDSELAEIAKEIRQLLDTATPRHQKFSTWRLPITGCDLFGRERKLRQLDEAWDDRGTNVLSLVAWGGVGKSALVNLWLAEMAREEYRGAEMVYGWSFYSQGTSDRAISADQFIEAALTWFGDKDSGEGAPWEKGERLARLVGGQRNILVLDGLEPLQQPPGPGEGRLKDQALQSLLRGLAEHNRGLCIITTRIAVADLSPFGNSTAPRVDLEHLSPEAGAQVLRAQGVIGAEDELRKASEEFGGHSLALTLLGSYLSDVCGGDIRRRNEVSDLEGDVRYGGHAERVMASYEKWFGEGPALAILRMLGLFRRPADREALTALRKASVIPGLPDLTAAGELTWRQELGRLRRASLVAEVNPRQPDVVDTHPLVRQHFGKQLRLNHPDAWRTGNGVLFDHFRLKVKSRPSTGAEMSFLYAAVIHGCLAGRHQRAFEVYYARIQRGQEFFSSNMLGTVKNDRDALSYFFEDGDWKRPVASIKQPWRALLQGQAGYRLWMLGDLDEAIAPMLAALEADKARAEKAQADEARAKKARPEKARAKKARAKKARGAWGYAAVDTYTLGAIYLTRGELTKALGYCERSVEYASSSLSDHQKVSAMNTKGAVLHYQGCLSEAGDVFRAAESIKKDMPEEDAQDTSFHHTLGHRYHDLLLSRGEYEEVEEIVKGIIKSEKRKSFHLIDIALNHLLLGRAHLLQADDGKSEHLGPAEACLNQALHDLKQTEREVYVPRGLLALAELYRVKGEFTRARANLDEAMNIASLGSMGLHQADCHLEYARLHLAQDEREPARAALEQAMGLAHSCGMALHESACHLEYARLHLAGGEKAKSRASWEQGREMIVRMGYRRRDRDVREIDGQLKAAGA